ncbi:hypothetical protein M9H77_18726 [Catharanthus roseus]|uniref:Uncharacterized protein n=1 Tax=Catharanthus roseus TaxID=4058 RepID=A0ACC0B8K2_CATRO|nr:hypothetical protein M9H77_18726 [Catharanthus roseus]
MCNTRVLGDKMNSGGGLSPQANNITVDDVMVGFTHEKKKIIDCLTRGLPQCGIIAIVGMPEYRIKAILIDIVKQVDPTVDISNKSPEDLAKMLYRCLREETYLILLNDIWDIRAWKELTASFPNDENGSRIIFTSRIHKVALEAKVDCNLHELYLLSPEDGLELLQKKLSCKDGLLAKADGDFVFWKQIAENLKSHVSREGCLDVLGGFDIVVITQLVHLRHWVLQGRFIVPPSIVNLSRLEFLFDIDFRGMNNLVGESIQLDSLQTLMSFRTYSEEELKWILRRMLNVQKLGISLNFPSRLPDFLEKIEFVKFTDR